MKKFLPLTFFLVSSLSLLATNSASADERVINDGLFAGVEISYPDTTYDYEDSNPGVGVTSQNPHVNGSRYGVFAGVGKNFADNNAYVGLRAGVQTGSSNSKVVEQGPGVSNTVSQGRAYSIDVLPGLFLGDQTGLIYLILGGVRSSVTLNASDLRASDTMYGWQGGFGCAFALSEHFSMHLEFIRNSFSDHTFNTPNHSYSVDPNTNALTLGIQYSFDGNRSNIFLD